MFQIPGRLAFFVEWMDGHDADLAFVANENSRHRMINGVRRMDAAR